VATPSEQARHTTVNRLATVGLGVFLWVSVGMLALGPRFSAIAALLVALWIALGSAHLVRNVRDFRGRMRLRRLLLATILSPAWPWIR
jgi:hypothetical protein